MIRLKLMLDQWKRKRKFIALLFLLDLLICLPFCHCYRIPTSIISYKVYKYINNLELGGISHLGSKENVLSDLSAILLDTSAERLSIEEPSPTSLIWDHAAECFRIHSDDVIIKKILPNALKESSDQHIGYGTATFLDAADYETSPSRPFKSEKTKSVLLAPITITSSEQIPADINKKNSFQLLLTGECPGKRKFKFKFSLSCLLKWDLDQVEMKGSIAYFKNSNVVGNACTKILHQVNKYSSTITSQWNTLDHNISIAIELINKNHLAFVIRYPDFFGGSGILKYRKIEHFLKDERIAPISIGQLIANDEEYRRLIFIVDNVLPILVSTNRFNTKTLPMWESAYTDSLMMGRSLLAGGSLSDERQQEIIQILQKLRNLIQSQINSAFPVLQKEPLQPTLRLATPSIEIYAPFSSHTPFMLRSCGPRLFLTSDDQQINLLSGGLSPYKLCSLLAPWNVSEDVSAEKQKNVPLAYFAEIVSNATIIPASAHRRIYLQCHIEKIQVPYRVMIKDFQGGRDKAHKDLLQNIIKFRNPPTIRTLIEDINMVYSSPLYHKNREKLLKLVHDSGASEQAKPREVFSMAPQ